MNQQRSRRFRAAQEAKDKEEARKESVALWECTSSMFVRQVTLTCEAAMGKWVSADDKNKKAWDSNAITPGTPFMALLASSLRYWVVQKMNSDAGWKNVGLSYGLTSHANHYFIKIQVIISDASVPGEGEHKIMDFIRRQRVNPGHDPNTRHVIYGLVGVTVAQ